MQRSRSSIVNRVFVALVAASALMLVTAGSALAVTFNADAPSLGTIADSPAGGSQCGEFTAAPRDVTFTVGGLPRAPASVAVGFSLETVSGTGPGHPFVGDLDVSLIGPGSAPTQSIFHNTGSTTPTGCGFGANAVGPYVFSDTALGSADLVVGGCGQLGRHDSRRLLSRLDARRGRRRRSERPDLADLREHPDLERDLDPSLP